MTNERLAEAAAWMDREVDDTVQRLRAVLADLPTPEARAEAVRRLEQWQAMEERSRLVAEGQRPN
jgi:hypothetical protein